MKPTYYLIEGINPEPWTAGTAYAGRSGGKRFTRVSKNQALVAYQNAVAEAVTSMLRADRPMEEGPLSLDVWFWRQLVSYQSDSGRMVTGHRADRTNMLKALEDALQPHKSRPNDFPLFKNDVQIVRGTVTVVEQSKTTEPRILFRLADALPVIGAHETVDRMLSRGMTRWEIA